MEPLVASPIFYWKQGQCNRCMAARHSLAAIGAVAKTANPAMVGDRRIEMGFW
jgi:hypothetical protein